LIHEGIVGPLFVEVLHLTFFQTGGLEGLSGTIGAVENGSVDHVAHLGTVEGLAFTRFSEVKGDDEVGITVESDLQPFFQICNCVHSFLTEINWIFKRRQSPS
jgi:hypothetical protein